jgi:hypothetical protein
MKKFDCEDCFDTGFIPDSFPLQPCHCISDEEIYIKAENLYPSKRNHFNKGIKFGYIKGSQHMRDKLLKMIK